MITIPKQKNPQQVKLDEQPRLIIAIGSDHAGFQLKNQIKTWLIQQKHLIIDVGTDNEDPTDYPFYTQKIAKLIQQKQANFAIVCCGSGVGVNIGMNRFFGIRALRCQSNDEQLVKLARQHNNINVLNFGQKFIKFQETKSLIEIFLNTNFITIDRYQKRNKQLDHQ